MTYTPYSRPQLMRIFGDCLRIGSVSPQSSLNNIKQLHANLKKWYNINIPISVLQTFASFDQLANFILSYSVSNSSGNVSQTKEGDVLTKEITGQYQPTTSNTTSFSNSEQEYLEELKECLADGELGSSERRLLNKLRDKLGISEERANELEASLSKPQLSEEEKEYVEAYHDALEDGVVSEKERRLLDKLMKINNISEERAKELEKI